MNVVMETAKAALQTIKTDDEAYAYWLGARKAFELMEQGAHTHEIDLATPFVEINGTSALRALAGKRIGVWHERQPR